MSNKLIGKIIFDKPLELKAYFKNKEIKLEEKNLDLFTYNSPSKHARSIGSHLSSFSKKCFGLPCYLYLIDDWLDVYFTILEVEKCFKRTKRYSKDDLKLYLIHKVIIFKITENLILSNNPNILETVARIKGIYEGHTLIGQAKKYLGLNMSLNNISSGEDFAEIKGQILQMKGE